MMLAWIRCMIRDRHMPTRYFLGGFKCTECGAVGADLDDMGYRGEGYVSLVSPARRGMERSGILSA
jgi:hypothetical protein